MKSQQQLAQDINAVTAIVTKIGVETGKTLDQVKALQKIIDDGGDSSEVEAALAALQVQAQKTDDLVPDGPVVAEPTS